MNRITTLLAILLWSSFSFAYSVQPMVTELKPSGREATRVFTIDNTYDEKLAVQVAAFTRSISTDGKEERKETKDFVIYPDQLAIGPKEKRSIRVTYVGPRDIKTQIPYRIAFDQMPVDLKKKSQKQGAQVRFMFNYVAAVYITPDGAEPKVEIESQKKVGDKFEVVFVNNGTAHKLLSHFDTYIVGDGVQKDVSDADQKALNSSNLLPQAKRKINFQIPKELQKASKLEIRIKAKKDI